MKIDIHPDRSCAPARGVLFFIVLVAALLAATSTVHAQSRAKPSKIQLFNGKDLDGWYTFLKGRGRNSDPKKVFTVEDGMLKISGEEWGCITTNDEYENYRLIVSYKWDGPTHAPREDKARDSGILIHSQGEDGAYDGTWMHSIECQIIEGGSGDFIVVSDGSDKFSITVPVAEEKQGGSHVFKPIGGKDVTVNRGRVNWFGRDPEWKDVKDFRGAKDLERAVGQWNMMIIEARGDQIKVYLNGALVNKATNVRPSKGRIQIQSEAAAISFKEVSLTPL